MRGHVVIAHCSNRLQHSPLTAIVEDAMLIKSLNSLISPLLGNMQSTCLTICNDSQDFTLCSSELESVVSLPGMVPPCGHQGQ